MEKGATDFIATGTVAGQARDGLEILRSAGLIRSVQSAAGLLYRRDYERLDPERSLTPPPLDGRRRKAVRCDVGWTERGRRRGLFIRDLEGVIQRRDPTFQGALGWRPIDRVGVAVWMLREVAGKGRSLRALSSDPPTLRRMLKGLRMALDCSSVAYGTVSGRR
ncbi:hypothetical protein [Brevundimonas faecalis]|uniref:Uncharacterized protein n=1 Tax=Brevundimonas faecalis TaxID=947378 RepID=A0ABV2RB10_9CAUL